MTNAIVLGVLALIGVIVYLIRGKLNAEKEMATSRETRKVALEKLEVVEKAALESEAQIREREAQELAAAYEAEKETYTRTSIGFYPTRVYRSKKRDLN